MSIRSIFLFFVYFLFFNKTFALDPISTSGNLEQVVTHVSDLTPQGLELKVKLAEIKSSSTDCEKSDEAKKKGPPEMKSGLSFFFDFKLMPTGSNGKREIVSQPVRAHHLPSWIKNLSTYLGTSERQVMQLPESELFGNLRKYTGTSGLSEDEKDMMAKNSLIMIKMAQKENAQDAFDFAASQLSSASREQKISFIATYLKSLNINYEYEMIRGGMKVNGVEYTGKEVGEKRFDDDLHQTLRDSFVSGTAQAKGGGVCRHMHLAAVRLANKLGFNETFGIYFRDSRAGHLDMVLTDPSKPSEVVQFNYDYLSTQSGVTGPSALSQNGLIPDVGIKFQLVDAKNRSVLVLPSELGGVLNRVTGGRDRDLNPRYQDDAQIQQAGIKMDVGSIRAFYAENPLGNSAQTGGASYNVRGELGKGFYVEAGAAAYSTKRQVQQGELTSSGLYGRVAVGHDIQHIDLPKLKIGTFSNVHLKGSVFFSDIEDNIPDAIKTGEVNEVINGDYSDTYDVGVTSQYQIGNVENKTTLLAHGHIEQSDLSNSGAPRPYLSTFSIDHTSQFPITASTDMNIGVGLTGFNLGKGIYPTYQSHLDLNSRSTKTSISIQSAGRLTSDTPIWLPGAEHRGTFSLTQGLFNNRFYLGLDGRKSFEIPNNHYVGIRFGGDL